MIEPNPITYRMSHEAAAGYGLEEEFQLSPQNPRDLANCMIDQLIEYAKINDFHYQKMMYQLGHVPAADGDDCIVNGLKNLKELVQKI